MLDPLRLLAQTEAPTMTTAAWIFMGAAWLFVTGLLVWAFWRVLGGGRRPS